MLWERRPGLFPVAPRCRSESYNVSTALWGLLTRLVGVLHSAKGSGRTTGVHWGAHQRFFRSMCMAGKVGGWVVGG